LEVSHGCVKQCVSSSAEIDTSTAYLYLKEFKENSKHFGNLIPGPLFENEKLFNTLEESGSYLLAEDSVSKNKQNNIRMEDTNCSQMRELVQELISQFQENQGGNSTQDKMIASFFVVDFIQANYDLEIMCVEKGEEFEEKMDVIKL
jgi:hypothetical protein